MTVFINKLMLWLWVVLLVLFLPTSSCLSMKNHGFTTVLLRLSLSCIEVTLMAVFFSSNPWTKYLFFLTILTTSIPTSPSHPSRKKRARYLSSMLKYLVRTVNFPPQFTVSPLLLVFSLTSTALFLLLTNALWFLAYFTESLIFVPTMKIFMLNLRLSGNCLT